MNVDNLKAVLSCHKITNPIMSCFLENQFDCQGSEIRREVKELRRSGIPVAACKDGYYMAQSYTEIEDTVDDLRSRAKSLSITANMLAKTFNVDLQGDLF